MPPFPLPPLNKAGGHPPPQWRMANEEATGGGLQTYLPNCCTSCHSTLSLFVCMVVHATSPKPFPSPLARVVVAPLQMRNLNVKTPSSLWTFHHAVPSPSFSTWELSVTENQCQSVCVCFVPCLTWSLLNALCDVFTTAARHPLPAPADPAWSFRVAWSTIGVPDPEAPVAGENTCKAPQKGGALVCVGSVPGNSRNLARQSVLKVL